ncbi:MAG: phage portal protein [Thermomonas hydrothermalis]|uniref:phage portal protein n=1 Tax=Thermomonas hydrothermalis TaxID=213588 RepID=UPI00235379FF|nr:phage portal protein [Thermomonas hydrothermalis]MCL6619481.1 phage portal protein [Thermomonas hydrothermalis]
MDVTLIKSGARPEAELLGAAGDEYPWPIDPARIIGWTQAEPTHARALALKAEGIAGQGFADEAARGLVAHDELVALALDLETYGNAFAVKVRDRTNRIARIDRLPAWSVRRTRAGGFRTRVWDGLREIRADYSAEDVIHIRLPSALPGWYATPAWAAASYVIELLDAITRYNTRFFEHNAVPDHVIKQSGGSLSDAQKAAIREFFQTEFKGLSNARKTLFVSLSEGQTLDIQAVAQPNDGRFIELYKTAREVLPTAHGVPPRLLGIATPGALGGLSEAREQMHMFETFTLAPRRRLLETALAPVLSEAGAQSAAITPPDLTPPGDDIAAIPQLVASGVMSVPEARAWIDLEKSAKTKAIDRAKLIASLLDAMGDGHPSPHGRGAGGEG